MSQEQKDYKRKFKALVEELKLFRQRIPTFTMQDLCREVDAIVGRATTEPAPVEKTTTTEEENNE